MGNKHMPIVEVLEVFKQYEEGATISHCVLILGIRRHVWYYWVSGDYHPEYRQAHIINYPEGKIAKYKGKSGSMYNNNRH